MKKAADIRELTNEELDLAIGEGRRELFNLKTRSHTGQLENVAQIRQARRGIARLLTEQGTRRNSGVMK